MHNLKENESIKYVGGAKITIGIASAIAFITAFVFGIIDGYFNPKACNIR